MEKGTLVYKACQHSMSALITMLTEYMFETGDLEFYKHHIIEITNSYINGAEFVYFTLMVWRNK